LKKLFVDGRTYGRTDGRTDGRTGRHFFPLILLGRLFEVDLIKDYSQGIVLLKLTTDRHEVSCGLSATAELLVSTYDRAMYSLSVLFSEILLFILENIY